MGNIVSFATQAFPGKPAWSVEAIPDLCGKVMVVTGGNAGIGKETAKVLLSRNAKVYIATRTRSRAESAIKELKEATGKEAYFLELDLADLRSIKSAAEELTNKEPKLHVLFNNGGVMMPPVKEITADGYDLQLGTNVLGHFYFTKLLLPTLIATAATSPDHHVRVVNLSSAAHYRTTNLNFATFKDGPVRQKQRPDTLYAQSKFANIVFSNELGRRFGNQGVLSIAVNPGNIRTDIYRHIPRFVNIILKVFQHPVELGALSQLWAGTTSDALQAQGKFLVPWAKIGTPWSKRAVLSWEKDLWDWMEEQIKDI